MKSNVHGTTTKDAIHDIKTILLQLIIQNRKDGRKEMFYLMTHSTHFIYCYRASNIS